MTSEILEREESLTIADIEMIKKVKKEEKLKKEKAELRKQIKAAKIKALMEDTDSDDENLRFTTKKMQVRESLIRKKYDEERDKERHEYAQRLEKLEKMLE